MFKMGNKKYRVLRKKIEKKQITEIIIIVVLSIIVYIFSFKHDALESTIKFLERHEKWEIDEFLTVSIFLVFALLFFSIRRWFEVREVNDMLVHQNNELERALSEIKRLRGILPICAECKRIRDDAGYWHQVELYIREHSEAEFSHSICPDCMRKLYPEFMEGESSNEG